MFCFCCLFFFFSEHVLYIGTIEMSKRGYVCNSQKSTFLACSNPWAGFPAPQRKTMIKNHPCFGGFVVYYDQELSDLPTVGGTYSDVFESTKCYQINICGLPACLWNSVHIKLRPLWLRTVSFSAKNRKSTCGERLPQSGYKISPSKLPACCFLDRYDARTLLQC